jgi:tetratricopeptide (TPR) repeat protein
LIDFIRNQMKKLLFILLLVCLSISEVYAQNSVRDLIQQQKPQAQETSPPKQEIKQEIKQEDPQQNDLAQKEKREKELKDQADQAFSKGNIEESLRFLQQAYEVNQNPRYLANQALMMIEIKKYQEALDLFEKFLATDPEKSKRDAALNHLNKLTPEVIITSDPDGVEILEGNKVIGRTPMKKRFLAGNHEITLRKSGYETQNNTLIVPFAKPAAAQYTLDVQNKKASNTVQVQSKSNLPALTAGPTTLLISSGLALVLSVGSIYLARDSVINRNEAVARDIWVSQQKDAEFYYDTSLVSAAISAICLGSGIAYWLLSEPSNQNSPFLRIKGLGVEGQF